MSHVVIVEPAARTSNEHELWRALPESRLTVISNRDSWDADRCIQLPAQRLPIVGGHEGWTAALARLQGISALDLTGVDTVVSVELFSPFSVQANRLARRLGARHVVSIAETMADCPVYTWPPYRQITRHLIPRVDAFACLTHKARQAAISIGCPPGQTFVVHPGVDTVLFSPSSDGLAAAPKILFVGMLHADRGADKGVLDLVDACERASNSVPGLQLTLVGEGHLRSQLEHLSDHLPFLQIHGRVPRHELPDLMRGHRILALPSRRTWKWEEQFGFVLVEAMACGLPVIGTRSGAIPEVVPVWNPIVEEGDTEALGDAIVGLLGPEGDEAGIKNRIAALDRFDLRQQGSRLREALNLVTQNSN